MAHRLEEPPSRRSAGTGPAVSGTTWRTVVVAALGLLPLLPEIARAANVETVPAVAATLAVVAAVNRILDLPPVEAWLRYHLPLMAKTRGPADDETE